MSIEKYIDYFHDGLIFEIRHEGNTMKISMESAQIDEEDLEDPLILSNFNTIRGILHIDGIISITEDEKPYRYIYCMKSNSAEIHDFEMRSKEIELQISWNTIPYDPKTSDFSVLKIEAEKIYWENVPDLVNPHW